MSAGLARSLVPIFVGGGIDTKIDPRLMPAGSLLELENVYQLRTGELRLRNGFAAIDQLARAINSGDNIFATLAGGLGSIARNWLGFFPAATPVKYSSVAVAGWEAAAARSSLPYPVMRARINGIEAAARPGGGAPVSVATDLVDPDSCAAGGTSLSVWREANAAGVAVKSSIVNTATGRLLKYNTFNVLVGRPALAVAGGSTFMCVVYADPSGTPSLIVETFDATGFQTGTTTVALNLVSAAQPWFDAKPIPGGNLIAIAYRASAGGVSCLVFNPATNTVTVGPVTTAGADASFCLGWLDDSLATGNMYLATAGSGSGVVVRTMLATTMVVSATNVIDATATANIRNITGQINTSATNYAVYWDVSGTPTYLDRIRVGRWTGAAAVNDHAPSFSIYSRTVKLSDGRYYLLGAYDSSVQPVYSLLGADTYDGAAQTPGPVSQCQVVPGEGGGRRTVQCSLTSPWANGSAFEMALTRKTKITTPGAPVQEGRAVVRASFTSSTRELFRPRELGGTLFIPGGILGRDDGVTINWALTPFYPEAPTLVSSATGSMTPGGAYVYRDVYKRTDASGRVTRSAGSVVAAVTLGGGDGRVTITSQNPRVPPANTENFIVEHYRAGPAAAGATGYNKVGESYAAYVAGGDTLTFVDSMSDTNAALGETAYFTGNVTENFVTPSCNLLEVNGNRVGIVNAEDPTEFWFSGEYKDRVGVKFNPLFKIRVSGDGYGAITALAAMDGRWILFKSSAIYVISGDGPNDLGQGSFNPPQAVSLSVGTVLPGSVVATPDGIMFQSAKGIYLLDRGLGLTYLGAPVEQYTLAANVVDASLVNGTTTVRFVFASGRCVEWDYFHKKWYTHQYRVGASTIVGCANIASGWCYALADGTVMQETPGVYSDVIGTSTAIVPRIGFPNLNLAGINGLQRVYGIHVEGEFVGNHTLQVVSVFNLGETTEPTRSLAITAGPYRYSVLNAQQKCSVIQPTITASLAAGSGGFRISGISLEVGIKKGAGIPYTKRAS